MVGTPLNTIAVSGNPFSPAEQRAAAAILEWIELAGPTEAARLAVACFDATVSEGEGAAHFGLYGIDAIDRNLEKALRLWCENALRPHALREVAA